AAGQGAAGGRPAVQPGVRAAADQGGARAGAAAAIPGAEPGGPAPPEGARGAGAGGGRACQPHARSEGRLTKSWGKGPDPPCLILKKVCYASPPAADTGWRARSASRRSTRSASKRMVLSAGTPGKRPACTSARSHRVVTPSWRAIGPRGKRAGRVAFM